MQYSNYALITALYANDTRGLYSDVYFPIIKYSICKIFSTKKDSLYSSADEIHDFIDTKFHINIPTIVIAMSVNKLGKRNWGNLNLEVFSNGSTFKIQKAYLDNTEEIEVDEREKEFAEKQNEIEYEYQLFIEREGLYNDGLTFIQFISDNTDDILGYFENKDLGKVDEKYATLIFFLQYLADHKSDLYNVANHLFWSSIIAAFLKSAKPLVNDEADGIKTEYFLDTSVVMGLLNLSTPQREINSKEVCKIIKSAGGILRVHPMTLREITVILQKVETSTPNPFTSIASAFDNYKYDTHSIASKRIHLNELIKEEGVSVFPNFSPVEQARAIEEYKGKRITRLLGETRSKKPESYSTDSYREIHDVFMHDYIKDRQKKHGGNVYFLTNNRDLISFSKSITPGVVTMVSTGKIILDLWMHNTKPVDVSGCALTETMAVCLEQHSTQIRSKIAEVARYYNNTKDHFDPELYKEFIQKLYKRAKHVITSIDADPDATGSIGETFSQMIAEAVKADNLHYDAVIANTNAENAMLSGKVEMSEAEINRLNEINASKQTTIDSLTTSLSEEQKNKAKAEADRDKERTARIEAENAAKTEKAAKEQEAKEKELYKELRLREERLLQVSNDIEVLQSRLGRDYRNIQTWVLSSIAGFIPVVILGVWLLVNLGIIDVKWNILWLLAIDVPFIAAAINSISTSNDRKEKYIKQQCKQSEQYKHLNIEEQNTEDRIKSIKNTLKI